MSMLRYRILAAFALLAAHAPVAGAATDAPTGIPNFHQVTEHIFRGGQPEADGWAQLAGLGVTTVIDLRRGVEHSISAESTAVTNAGMQYLNFPMNGFDTPTAEQMARALELLDRPGNLFVHCKQGRDRTGTVIAAYRISRQHWEPPRALAEARSLGMHWYESGMKRFIAGYRPAPATESKALALSSAPSSSTAPVDSTAVHPPK